MALSLATSLQSYYCVEVARCRLPVQSGERGNCCDVGALRLLLTCLGFTQITDAPQEPIKTTHPTSSSSRVVGQIQRMSSGTGSPSICAVTRARRIRASFLAIMRPVSDWVVPLCRSGSFMLPSMALS